VPGIRFYDRRLACFSSLDQSFMHVVVFFHSIEVCANVQCL